VPTPEKTFQANEIVKDPTILMPYFGYAIIVDTSMSSSFDNMVKALNSLEEGWEVVSMTKDDTRLVILIHRSEKAKRSL